MRLGPVPAGPVPVHSCVGAAGRFAAVRCVKGGVFRGIKSSSSSIPTCFVRVFGGVVVPVLCVLCV